MSGLIGDDWYDSEERTRSGLRAELQRIRLRTRNRPIRVLLVAAFLTSAIVWRITTKPRVYEASVVLVMSEESLSSKNRQSLPVDELRQYVLSVLLPADDLLAIVDKHGMFPLRKKLGDEFALSELWQEIDVAIWKNSFIEADEANTQSLNSARIGITVSDRDPELAFALAREIAAVIIATGEEQRVKVAAEVKAEVDAARVALGHRQEEITKAISQKVSAVERARARGKPGLAAALGLDVAELVREQKSVNTGLTNALSSEDAIADQITAAGLDMSISIVDEQRPDVANHQRGFVLVLMIVVIAFGAFVASALVLGAFDSKVHDTDDVERLGLPVLGHVPGFQGDNVGSLEARGARRSRVPSFLRWRSHR